MRMAEAAHNSQDVFYRSPFGAVTCGERVTLRLRVDASLEDASATVKLWSTESVCDVEMIRTGSGGVWNTFEAVFGVPPEPCVVWYHFQVCAANRVLYIGNADDSMGGSGQVRDNPPPSFQITVYDGRFAPPRWMRDGIVYHIFPDRFHDGYNGELLKRRSDILIHKNWAEPPDAIDADAPPQDVAKDFFGGNLKGIEQKLDYLQSLSVSALYINPVFRANSNHKYDTGDYTQIDPTFGDDEDFRALCAAARKKGIHVILDGVFSHTGEDSVYFNRYGNYEGNGAYQSKQSPYYSWYKFKEYPNDYVCWWGVPTLPEIDEMNPAFLDFIIRSPDAVIAKWLRLGSSGWRLDVADELPDEFIFMLRERVRMESGEACVIGEVWEDATNKIAYGQPRRYALGRGLDSVMNYPLRTALIDFLIGRERSALTRRRILCQKENYPRPMYYSMMNLLGSHDRVRILNMLAQRDDPGVPEAEMGQYRLKPDEYTLGAARLRMMISLVAALPGMPTVYYGDEAGVQGLKDPFCRAAYPWGHEDGALLEHFRQALALRRSMQVLRTGELSVFAPHPDVLCVLRTIKGGRDALGVLADDAVAFAATNRSSERRRVVVDLAVGNHEILVTMDGDIHECPAGVVSLDLAPMSCVLVVDKASQIQWKNENSAGQNNFR